MRDSDRFIGGELFLGAVYGLGMSIIIWIPLNTGSLADGGLALFCAAGVLAGLSRSWAGWPAPAALPWIVAAWLLAGPPAALLVAVPAALGSRLLTGWRGTAARLAFDAGAAALAVVAAGAIAAQLTDSVLAFASLFVLLSLALHALRRRLAGIAHDRPGRDLIWSLVLVVAGTAVAFGLGSIWAQPPLRSLLFVLAAVRAGWLAHVASAGLHRRRNRPARPVAAERLRDRVAAALAQAQPAGVAAAHLWRTAALCTAIGERLGSDPDEIRYLNQAALLHHAGRLAHQDETIEIHPCVVVETVAQLGFAAEVQSILRDTQEQWNGKGPRGLGGERIERNARILAVADRYDQLAHKQGSSHNHIATMAELHPQSGSRFDPLMLEILDELADRLTASGADLTRSSDEAIPAAVAGSRLVDGERDLQALYAIERATELPIGLRERLTLIAGLLRRVVPFDHLRIETQDGTAFHYGDHKPGPVDESFPLLADGRTSGDLVLCLKRERTLDAPRRERLQRVTTLLARMLLRERESQRTASLTDPATGLPNARYLRRTLRLRLPEAGHAGPGCGILALHLRHTAGNEPVSDQLLKIVAGRLAAACDERETLVRFGPDQFLVVTSESRGGKLVSRWHELVDDAVDSPILLDGAEIHVRIDGAHAAHPLDGERLEELLATLETRLNCTDSSRVVPFRKRRAG